MYFYEFEFPKDWKSVIYSKQIRFLVFFSAQFPIHWNMQNTKFSRTRKQVSVGDDVHYALKLQAAKQRESLESLADRVLREYLTEKGALDKQPQEALAS